MMTRVEAAQRICGDAVSEGQSALQLCAFARGLQAASSCKAAGMCPREPTEALGCDQLTQVPLPNLQLGKCTRRTCR